MRDSGVSRVLMTCDTVGGVWTFAMELAEGLASNGVEVVLASLGALPSAEQEAAAARIPNLCLLPSEFKLEWMEDPWRDVAESGRWLMELAREYAPDVIHFNSYGHGALAFAPPVVLTAHSCVLSWWQAVRGAAAPPEWDCYRSTVSSALHSATAVTAPSRFIASAIAQHYRFNAQRIQVIPNGRNPGQFHSGLKEPFIFSAGRLWDEAKNVAALAEVAASLSWPVYVAGERKMNTEAGVAGCRPLGMLAPNQMAEWYGRASIYALPARYEPFGLSVLEAALSHCALVLGDIPSLRETWGDAALLVPPDDRDALAGAIKNLIGDAKLREDLSQRGYEVARRYRAALMTDRYLNLYQAAAYGKPICVS